MNTANLTTKLTTKLIPISCNSRDKFHCSDNIENIRDCFSDKFKILNLDLTCNTFIYKKLSSLIIELYQFSCVQYKNKIMNKDSWKR